MRFIVDQAVSPNAAKWLAEKGHDAIHVRDRGMSRAKDEAIFALAAAEDRVIVTADLDFSRILALSGKDQPGLITFRAGNISDAQMLSLLERVLVRVDSTVIPRSAITVDSHSIRVAALPIRPDLAG